MGILEGEEREKGAESLFKEIIAENFPNLGKRPELQVKEANITPNSINVKRPSPRYRVVKLAKVKKKEKILRAAKQKKITYKRTPSGFQWISQQKSCRLGENGMYVQNTERQKLSAKNTLPSETIFHR